MMKMNLFDVISHILFTTAILFYILVYDLRVFFYFFNFISLYIMIFTSLLIYILYSLLMTFSYSSQNLVFVIL